ncbi:efflux RND transporter periplasmic adaptor subunit [Streptomyces sp. NBC_00083]|uniref:efflux RND transporter periplasmic adaptor subunit n=1 Tax=Streptomyces sp. NBC_00083 TaxID=2975647 RepID=UPI002250EA0C|nr:HlyD family efflux transporter periplasmic adaptor subunit [Streptomyces sp. NBC_00083]MCX5384132.1 HlyD family efflux transporter periplasmic adaptor subunit [Streptomyces sp. NBC_00083]
MQATVAGPGLLTSPSDAGVNFTTGGQLTKVDVKPGDKVAKGQVLAKVDDKAARLVLAQAKISLAAAKANLDQVAHGQPAGPLPSTGTNPTGGATHSTGPTPKTTPTPTPTPTPTKPTPTPSDTAPPGILSGVSFVHDVSYVRVVPVANPSVDPTQLLQAQTQVAQAQSAVDTAQRTLDGTVLTAPVDGTVASVGATVGQTVTGTTYTAGAGAVPGAVPAPGATGNPATGGTPAAPSGFIVLTNPTGMQVKANVSEADALRLKPGQAATVTLTAQSTTVLNAKVLSVGTLAVNGGAPANAAQYPVTLDIMGPTKDLHTGQGVSVQIVAGEAADALFVPTAALSGTGPRRTVTVVAPDGATHPTEVTVGVESDTNTQITGGLTLGQKVRITTLAP